MNDYYRVWANINLDYIQHNLSELQRNAGNTLICAVVKADGYGHGAIPIAKAIEQNVWGFCVATIKEAINLREGGIEAPILTMGYTHYNHIEDCLFYHITPVIYSYEVALEIQEAMERYQMKTGENKVLGVHIKLDTGMCRFGFSCDYDGMNQIKQLTHLSCIHMEGIYTHFARADEVNKEPTNKQFEMFVAFCEQLTKEDIHIPLRHCANSAGLIDMASTSLGMARVGISLYGIYPSEEVEKKEVLLKPALALKSHIVAIRDIDAGVPISYGGTYTTTKKSRIAVIPVGYADGYPRSLSDKGYVLIRGKKAPICGRICMDCFMVDVTNIKDATMHDKVTLIGEDGNEKITVDELAKLSQRFAYEFLCDLSKRVPRVYWQKGIIVGKKDYFSALIN